MGSGVSIAGPGSGGNRHSRLKRRRPRQAFALQLTSMMDVLMIIVVFLLKSYGISSMGIVQTDKLELPISRAPELYGEGLALIISKEKILLESEEILRFKDAPPPADPAAPAQPAQPANVNVTAAPPKFELPEGTYDLSASERGILPLYDALKKKKEEYELLASRSPDPKTAQEKWKGEVMVQADKQVPYEMIRRVMYTSGMAGYKVFRLTVEKQSE